MKSSIEGSKLNPQTLGSEHVVCPECFVCPTTGAIG